ncbi:MAG: hypothetical protein G01um10142_357 [Parcubacteria group bacterium Gr01-1014_2]|nr:MAG: hypothetical protein G01um10142_357 [Parcubacteria group bacterium Gr01-1014_2]
MDSLFTKAVFLFSFLLASIISPGYIKVAKNELDFNFKTGEVFPIYYYLNVQNIGPQKARFEISSDASWLRFYREGTDFTFVELPLQAYINFVLEIRPERLPDGVNKAKVLMKVLDIDSLVSQEVVLDEAEISLTLNKNFVPTPSSTAAVSPISSPAQSPSPTLSATPIQPPTTSQPTLSPFKTAVPLSKPVRPGSLSPSFSPVSSPVSSPVPQSILKQLESVLNSLKLFLKKLF